MQKLITVYLDNSSYDKGTLLGRSGADKHGIIEECLSEYLNDGWKVVQLTSFGGTNDFGRTSGWVTVLIEKN